MIERANSDHHSSELVWEVYVFHETCLTITMNTRLYKRKKYTPIEVTKSLVTVAQLSSELIQPRLERTNSLILENMGKTSVSQPFIA